MSAQKRDAPPEHGPHLLRPFKLERFFSIHEFRAPYLLCCSDTQPLQLSELLQLADEDSNRRWEQLSLGYTEAQGLPALREAIAASPCHYTTVAADDLMICAPEEGVYLAMLAALSPGDRVIVTYPGYQSLHEIALSLGCHVTFWELESSGPGGLRFDVQRLLSLLDQEGCTKMVVVNFPHNPSGWLPTQQEWQQIVNACRQAGAILFSDEMYRGMEFDSSAKLPAAVDVYDSAISLCGMSKAVGLPGLRIGWLASHNTAVMQRVAELKDYTTICSSAPSEVLALAGVRAWPALLDRQMARVRANLRALEAFFEEWSGVLEWERPRAGAIAFPRLCTGDVEAFCNTLVEEAGVLLLPATVYDHAPSSAEGRLRIGFGRANLPHCLERLGEWLAKRHPAARGGAAV